MAYTTATLGLSPQAFSEIKARLRAAHYEHTFMLGAINMNGIAVELDPALEPHGAIVIDARTAADAPAGVVDALRRIANVGASESHPGHHNGALHLRCRSCQYRWCPSVEGEKHAQNCPAMIARAALSTIPDALAAVALLREMSVWDMGSPWNKKIEDALATITDAPAASGMVEVAQEDANNYCRILTVLGMEEEGDPVAEIERLVAAASPSRELHKFVNACAGEGLVMDGIDAAELYIALFPGQYAAAVAQIDTGVAEAQPGQHTHADPRLERAQRTMDARFQSARAAPLQFDDFQEPSELDVERDGGPTPAPTNPGQACAPHMCNWVACKPHEVGAHRCTVCGDTLPF